MNAKSRRRVLRSQSHTCICVDILVINGTGFTAYATEDHIYAAGERIQFPEVYYNRGGHYNSADSSFTVPLTGTYLFMVNIMSKWEYYQRSFLVRNSEDVVFLYGDPSGSMMASNSVLLQCQAGDVLYVRATHDDSFVRVYDKAATTFSGLLLYVST